MLQFLNSDFSRFTQQEKNNQQEEHEQRDEHQSDHEIQPPKSVSLGRVNRVKSFEEHTQAKPQSSLFQQLLQNQRLVRKSHKRQQIIVDPKSIQLTINLTTCPIDFQILRKVMEKNNWKKAFNFDGDILWSGKTFTYDFAMVFLNQTISRIPGMKVLANKRETSYIMAKATEYFPTFFNFYPKSYTLPEEMPLLIRDYKENKDQQYIAKPEKGTQGQGIFLVKELEDLFTNGIVDMQYCRKNLVIQEYIGKPLLVDDKKFDLRLYVLITSLNPLVVYLNEEGLARFCTENYEQLNPNNLSNTFMHLTNYSLNKNSTNFIQQPQDFLKMNNASKRTYTSTKKTMLKMGIDVPKLKLRIEQSIARFIYAMSPFLLHSLREVYQDKWNSAKCFHLLGIDVLIDENLKPWILEVNANPSLEITQVSFNPNGTKKIDNSLLDIHVKQKILEDAFLISVKPAKDQILTIGKGKYFNSYKMIIDGQPPLENLDLFNKMLTIYGNLCGHKYGNLNQVKFSRLANNPQLLNEYLIKSDYDIIYKKVLIKSMQSEMNFKCFIETLESIAEKLLKNKASNYTLQKAVFWVIKAAQQQQQQQLIPGRPQTAKR